MHRSVYISLIIFASTSLAYAQSEQEVKNLVNSIGAANEAVHNQTPGTSSDCNCELTASGGWVRQTLSSSFNAACAGFIDQNGEYGPWGMMVLNTLEGARSSNSNYDVFFADETASIHGMSDLCPRWRELSLDQRKNFWVWTFASISMAESTCAVNRTQNNPLRVWGVDDWAVGLTQLNETYSKRYWRSRDAGGNGYCAVDNVELPDENNLACAIDIMLGHLVGVYRDPPSIINNSYWQELRSSGGKIANFIRELDICHDRQSI